MVKKYALNKGYALIDVLTTPTCMVMVASASAISNVDLREGGVREQDYNIIVIVNMLKNTWSGGSYEIERTKLKISTMTSVGDME